MGIVMPKLDSTRTVLALALLGVCIGGEHPAWSQNGTAAITGSVVDPTGASIVGATFTAKDTERGTVYTAQTNSVGVFNLPLVPVTTYDLKVGAPGISDRCSPLNYAVAEPSCMR
jgi:hypothetical protein